MVYKDKHGFKVDSDSNIVIGQDAVNGMMNGIKVATRALRRTYGSKGHNAVIENEMYPYHQVANDAQTIIQAIEVEDPVERIGLDLLKELSEKADKDSGDGRKTTLIMAEEILEAGYRSGVDGLTLKRELDSYIPVIEAMIDEKKTQITEKDVWKVATIAGESKTLGETIGKIYQSIGKEGIIQPEASGTWDTSFNVIEGVRFQDTGYLSPYMAHDEQAVKDGRKETRAVYTNPLILVTKKKIEHINDINPLLSVLTKQGKKDLVIFTDDMDSGVASLMVKAHKEHIMNLLVIKAPVLWKQYIFEDFAKVTGATIVEDATGINYKNLELKHLGTCGKIIVDKTETILLGTAEITDHLSELKANDDIDSKLRLSWLTTKTAILKLGANNESELSYLRLKCYDAINSSRLALKDGVVKGGGIALNDVSLRFAGANEASTILRSALAAPLTQNLANIGVDAPNWGNDIVDAAAVVKNAVRNAIALASTVLTTDIVINLPPPTQEDLLQRAVTANKMKF